MQSSQYSRFSSGKSEKFDRAEPGSKVSSSSSTSSTSWGMAPGFGGGLGVMEIESLHGQEMWMVGKGGIVVESVSRSRCWFIRGLFQLIVSQYLSMYRCGGFYAL